MLACTVTQNTYRTRVRELSLKVSVIFQLLVIEVAHDHIDKGEGGCVVGVKGTCSGVKRKLLFHFFLNPSPSWPGRKYMELKLQKKT